MHLNSENNKNLDDEHDNMETESLDLEELVKKARRSREIGESDVQAILAKATDDEAGVLYDRLQKLNIRIVSESGETVDSNGSTGLLDSVNDPAESLEDTTYLETVVEDDPVHTYLKEIGRVPLLLPEQEIWLSTQLSAANTLDRLNTDDVGLERAMLTNYEELLESWATVEAAREILGVMPIDLHELVEEARNLRTNWRDMKGSYLRDYLNEGRWGQDEAWGDLAGGVFEVFNAIYLLPTELSDAALNDYEENGRWTDIGTFSNWVQDGEASLSYMNL